MDANDFDAFRRCDALCSRFERAWLAGEPQSISSYLLLCDAQDRERVVRELLLVEWELRRKSESSWCVEEYHRQLPEFRGIIDELWETSQVDLKKQDDLTGIDALRVRCPHCHNCTRFAADVDWDNCLCPACLGRFSLVRSERWRSAAEVDDRIGQFRLLERVGSGAFGSVWKAQDTQLDRVVALKLPRQTLFQEETKKAFLREAQSVARLAHPYIVSVYEVGCAGDSHYIVSEFVPGVTLEAWMRERRMSACEAAALCAKLADALCHAHQRGVVHRDLKPSNIMLDHAGNPRLMDFGLAKRDYAQATVSLDGQLLGTPAYMSPEQARGDVHQTDHRSDLYSLGVVLFQLLTGELPFRGSLHVVLHRVVHDEAPRPRKLNAAVPRDLETICLKCLQKVRHHRYATAAELRDELQRFLALEPIRARPSSSLGHFRRWARPARFAVITWIAWFCLAVLVCGSLLSTRRSRAWIDHGPSRQPTSRAAARVKNATDEGLSYALSADGNLEEINAQGATRRITPSVAKFALHDGLIVVLREYCDLDYVSRGGTVQRAALHVADFAIDQDWLLVLRENGDLDRVKRDKTCRPVTAGVARFAVVDDQIFVLREYGDLDQVERDGVSRCLARIVVDFATVDDQFVVLREHGGLDRVDRDATACRITDGVVDFAIVGGEILVLRDDGDLEWVDYQGESRRVATGVVGVAVDGSEVFLRDASGVVSQVGPQGMPDPIADEMAGLAVNRGQLICLDQSGLLMLLSRNGTRTALLPDVEAFAVQRGNIFALHQQGELVVMNEDATRRCMLTGVTQFHVQRGNIFALQTHGELFVMNEDGTKRSMLTDVAEFYVQRGNIVALQSNGDTWVVDENATKRSRTTAEATSPARRGNVFAIQDSQVQSLESPRSSVSRAPNAQPTSGTRRPS